MRRAIVAVSLAVALAGCGGGHKAAAKGETAHDVEAQMMKVHTGLLANPQSVSCKRGSPKFWNCEITQRQPADSLGTSSAEVRVLVRTPVR
jgi:hypothetical protein